MFLNWIRVFQFHLHSYLDFVKYFYLFIEFTFEILNYLCHFTQPHIGVFLNCTRELILMIIKVFAACVLFKPLEFFDHLRDYSFELWVLGSSRQFSLENISTVWEGNILPWLLRLLVFGNVTWAGELSSSENIFIFIGEMEVISVQWLPRKHAKVTPSWINVGRQGPGHSQVTCSKLGLRVWEWCRWEETPTAYFSVRSPIFYLLNTSFSSQHQCFSFSGSKIVIGVNSWSWNLPAFTRVHYSSRH